MSSVVTYVDDPTATYRGYRRQALYCLWRLFDDGLPNDYVVQPEGNEDLAIHSSSGELLEVIQVKDHTADLTASKFKPFFYRRISQLCQTNPTVKITIASFGPIGPQLANAYDNSRITPQQALDTLIKDREVKDAQGNTTIAKGLSQAEAVEVFARVDLREVDENILENETIARLSSTMTSGDPTVAFENLMWWLISSAEKKLKLTRQSTIAKIFELGRFLTHRAAHEYEWNMSIKPIATPAKASFGIEKLKNDFFQGGRVILEHISANLDVPRDDELEKINASFKQENVVVLRAASGQGKTTLAYRYLLEWTSADFRYQVEKAADLQHARRMAAALKGHSELIDVPTIVYIDVHPGDTLWLEIVRELSSIRGIRVLVTIREEDWFRSRVSKDDFAYIDIAVSFTELVAKNIFKVLKANGYGRAQIDFIDAWNQVGHQKTLFEFVYLITQNEHLAEKIGSQVSILKDEVNCGQLRAEELQLLRLVAVASAYEARLDTKLLIAKTGVLEPSRTLQKFSNEYLLRTSTDGCIVEGFHAIRSEIVATELTDECLNPRSEIEAILPALLVEDDIENFLLCAFSRNQGYCELLVESLFRVQIETWVGIRGILVALLWLGLKKYVSVNTDAIDEIQKRHPGLWWLLLDWDLAHINGDKGFDLSVFQEVNSSFSLAMDEVRAKQSDKNSVFSYAKDWLIRFQAPKEQVTSASNFSALGETVYWLGHLKLSNDSVVASLNGAVVSKAWSLLPLHLFAQFARGIQTFSASLYTDWLEANLITVNTKLRATSAIIAIEKEEEDCLVAHFAIDINQKASNLEVPDEMASINDLAVQRVEILSACLPGYSSYGAAGYGHRMSFFEQLRAYPKTEFEKMNWY